MLPPESPLMDYLRDRVGRAQRELAVRLKAELNSEDRPAPTRATFDQRAFDEDQRAVPARDVTPVPIMELFAGYLAERQPAAARASPSAKGSAELISPASSDSLFSLRK